MEISERVHPEELDKNKLKPQDLNKLLSKPKKAE